MTPRPSFRSAVETQSLDEILALFRDDAVLHSPITFQPFEGKAAIRRLLAIILEVFQEFRYTDELDDAAGRTKILVFRCTVESAGGKRREAEGIDLLRFDADGRIAELTVMVRPRSSLEAVLAEVQPRLMAALAAAT